MRWLWQDKAIVFILVAGVFLRFLTAYYLSYAAAGSFAEVVAENADFLEANPVAAAIFKLGNLGLILQVIVLPALLVAVYVIYRRFLFAKLPAELADVYLTFKVVTLLVAVCINLFNDGGAVLGLWLGGVGR